VRELTERDGDEVAGEDVGVLDEVEGGDIGVLLFDEDEGAEVEALDVGAGLHAGAGDGAAEGIDEDLRGDGVIFEHFGREGGVLSPGAGWRQDFGFEIEADAVGGEGSLGGVRVRFAGAGAVVVRVETGEVEELLDVSRDPGADEIFMLCEGYGYRGEGEVVLLVRTEVELVADVGLLGFFYGDVADIDAVFEGIRGSVGSAAGLGVEELIVPDEGDVVGGDAGVGFDGVDAVVEANFKER